MEVKLQLLLQTLDGHNGVWSTRAMLVHPSTLTEEEWNKTTYIPIQGLGRKSRLVKYSRVVSVDLPVTIGERNYITEKGVSLSPARDFSFEIHNHEDLPLILKYLVLNEETRWWNAIKIFRFSLPKEVCDE